MSKETVRVLHVFGRMNRGGAELRTIDVISYLNNPNIEHHFCVVKGLVGTLDDEIREMGGYVHYVRLNPLFAVRFPALLRREGIDVVHSHVHYATGIMLMLSAWAGVPSRIAHFRSSSDGKSLTPRRRLQNFIGAALIDRYATAVLAVSESTMTHVWDESWRADSRFEVVYNGVDQGERTFDAQERLDIRRSLDIGSSTPLILHVGRFDPAKNHLRLIRLFKEVLSRHPGAVLLLAGRGGTPTHEKTIELIKALELGGKIRLLGERDDVSTLMVGADLLIFPSLWEGLPGSVLEAGAVGLPALASDLDVIREIQRSGAYPYLHCLSLDEPDTAWADLAVDLVRVGKDSRVRVEGVDAFRVGEFRISEAASRLSRLWTAHRPVSS